MILNFYGALGKSVKLNFYPNSQLPGSLWYHDHAMASTGFNVKHGLAGMYILRNSTYEGSLPSGEYEKMLLISVP